jgi:hypothetical protein
LGFSSPTRQTVERPHIGAHDLATALRRSEALEVPSIRTSNAIECLHEEFKRRIKTQTVLPSAETDAILFWALLLPCAQVDANNCMIEIIDEPYTGDDCADHDLRRNKIARPAIRRKSAA